MELIDLHTHTTASDGIYSPAALIDLAIEKGVGVLAITDHDTVGGLAEALGHAAEKKFRLIPGIEFSIDFRGGSFHLVGLGIDHRNGDLLEVTEGLRKTRSTRITRIVEDLGKHGIVVSEDEIIKEAGGESMGRPHVARVLIRHGFGKDMEDIFAHYLVPGRPGYVKKDKIQLAEAIRLIRGAGGIAIIAHPKSLGFEKFSRFVPMLEDFIRQGVEGLEVYAAMHDESYVDQFRTLAGKYSLVMSGGSDFHGDKCEKLGYYSPIRTIPAEIFLPLRERMGTIF